MSVDLQAQARWELCGPGGTGATVVNIKDIFEPESSRCIHNARHLIQSLGLVGTGRLSQRLQPGLGSGPGPLAIKPPSQQPLGPARTRSNAVMARRIRDSDTPYSDSALCSGPGGG